MSGSLAHEDFNTVLGGDITITGEVRVQKPIRIDGKVDGALLSSGSVLVGKNGQVQGNLQGARVQIEGTVSGSCQANDLHLDATSNVQADLEANNLNIAEGAQFEGQVKIAPKVKEAAKPEKTEAQKSTSDKSSNSIPISEASKKTA